MNDIYENTKYIPDKEKEVLIVFDDMISNKKFNPIVTKLFIRGRNLNISLVFITQSYFAVPKNIRLDSTLFYYANLKQARASTNCI